MRGWGCVCGSRVIENDEYGCAGLVSVDDEWDCIGRVSVDDDCGCDSRVGVDDESVCGGFGREYGFGSVDDKCVCDWRFCTGGVCVDDECICWCGGDGVKVIEGSAIDCEGCVIDKKDSFTREG